MSCAGKSRLFRALAQLDCTFEGDILLQVPSHLLYRQALITARQLLTGKCDPSSRANSTSLQSEHCVACYVPHLHRHVLLMYTYPQVLKLLSNCCHWLLVLAKHNHFPNTCSTSATFLIFGTSPCVRSGIQPSCICRARVLRRRVFHPGEGRSATYQTPRHPFWYPQKKHFCRSCRSAAAPRCLPTLPRSSPTSERLQSSWVCHPVPCRGLSQFSQLESDSE